MNVAHQKVQNNSFGNGVNKKMLLIPIVGKLAIFFKQLFKIFKRRRIVDDITRLNINNVNIIACSEHALFIFVSQGFACYNCMNFTNIFLSNRQIFVGNYPLHSLIIVRDHLLRNISGLAIVFKHFTRNFTCGRCSL